MTGGSPYGYFDTLLRGDSRNTKGQNEPLAAFRKEIDNWSHAVSPGDGFSKKNVSDHTNLPGKSSTPRNANTIGKIA